MTASCITNPVVKGQTVDGVSLAELEVRAMSEFWAERYARPMFGFPITDWHRAFAWLPVQTFDGRWVWMRPIMRRRYSLYEYLSGGPDQWSIYATVKQ